MLQWGRWCGAVALATSALACAQVSRPIVATTISDLYAGFEKPPDDARIMMRWWWFGPAVQHGELERELLAMKQGGIGGVEIQPVYAMALDDHATGFHNTPYLSPEFLDDVAFTARTARANGMRVDMTLASGWPYGGPHVAVDEASARLRVVAVDVPADAGSIALPSMGNGESMLASFVGAGSAAQWSPKGLQMAQLATANGRARFEPASQSRVCVFFIESRTGQQVKRAAVGAEGFVLDHFSRAAVESHLHTVGEPLMKAFGDHPPYAVFSDSLEVYGADWTDDFLAQFQRRRGYDLRPLLPALVKGDDATAAALRHDWGLTLTELIDENYLTPINTWAKQHGTRFRSQTYGDPAVSLSSNALVTLPEGEGPQWDRFSYTRWASSASHLYGRPITSSETWTWLHSPAFRATPLDMKAEADRFFLEGVNQLIGHGWPYTPPSVAEPGWSFYAAAVFNDHNPWWLVMPDVTRYLQRMSWLLRQGKPANDVAVYLPEDDAYAEFRPGKVSISDLMPQFITPALMQSIEAAGYNVDFIDAKAIATVGVPYGVLVVPHTTRMSAATAEQLAAYVARGGKVVFVGGAPTLAPGYLHAKEETNALTTAMSRIMASATQVKAVPEDAATGDALQGLLPPDLAFAGAHTGIGFLHRKLELADVYFIANTENSAQTITVDLRARRAHRTAWNVMTGDATTLPDGPLQLQLAPYESRVLVESDAALQTAKTGGSDASAATVLATLAKDWQVRFVDRSHGIVSSETMQSLHSWSDDAATRYFSGVGVYTHSFEVSAASLGAGHRIVLDFGEGERVAPNPAVRSGMRALLEGPLREAAAVYVNGERVGAVWCAPWTLDITKAVKTGSNMLEVRVGNTDINLLAGQTPPDYHLLNLRYGEKFRPQDRDHLQPLPSGMLQAPKIVEMR